MPTISGNRVLLEAALEGLQIRRAKLDEQIASLRSLMGGRNGAAASEAAAPPARRKRRMSAAGRKRIAEAARKRWAAYNAEKQAGRKGR